MLTHVALGFRFGASVHDHHVGLMRLVSAMHEGRAKRQRKLAGGFRRFAAHAHAADG